MWTYQRKFEASEIYLNTSLNSNFSDSAISANPNTMIKITAVLLALCNSSSPFSSFYSSSSRITLRSATSQSPNEIPIPLVDLQTFLKLTALVETGGEAKTLIQAGEVMLNGKVETRRAKKLFSGDLVSLEDVTKDVQAEVATHKFVYKAKISKTKGEKKMRDLRAARKEEEESTATFGGTFRTEEWRKARKLKKLERKVENGGKPITPKKPTPTKPTTRREIISSVALSSALLASPLAFTPSANAEVSDGTSLPPSMQHFADVLLYKREWSNVAKSLKEKSDLSDGEWKSISLGLRRYYTCNEDLKYLAKSFGDDKKPTAERIVTDFKKLIKDTDKLLLVSDGGAKGEDRNVKLILKNIDASLSMLSEFLDLQNDVPDL
ncbi:hypothetical protein ScalyP_jg11209 [Parmales sp. scaly parma]|nr:hypothetical protein ScalyP_jg11209 [Parmales sp. scaly parma]